MFDREVVSVLTFCFKWIKVFVKMFYEWFRKVINIFDIEQNTCSYNVLILTNWVSSEII
jgi:hypothetical protein